MRYDPYIGRPTHIWVIRRQTVEYCRSAQVTSVSSLLVLYSVLLYSILLYSIIMLKALKKPSSAKQVC